MFTKNYWNELIKKMTIFEWCMIIFAWLLIEFFSIADIDSNHHLIINPLWTGKWIGTVGQLIIMISGTCSALTVMNRLHRFKQEIVWLLVGEVSIGIGMMIVGYSAYFYPSANNIPAFTLAPGIIITFIFGMSALGGFTHFSKKETNVIPAKRKFLSKELMIAIGFTLMSIIPFYILFSTLQANTTKGSTGDIGVVTWKTWMGILAFSFACAAMVVMTLYRWTWTLIFWNISNLLFIIFYIESNIFALAAIGFLFFMVTFYALAKWLKDQKLEAKKLGIKNNNNIS